MILALEDVLFRIRKFIWSLKWTLNSELVKFASILYLARISGIPVTLLVHCPFSVYSILWPYHIFVTLVNYSFLKYPTCSAILFISLMLSTFCYPFTNLLIFQVAIFLVLAMVLRRKPDVLINLLPKLSQNSKYQGQDKLPVIIWMIVQVRSYITPLYTVNSVHMDALIFIPGAFVIPS